MARTSRAAATGTRNGSHDEPTPGQAILLDAYLANPNAAAVARDHRKSERNVRRIVEKFGPLLDDRRRARDAERHARAGARQARIDDWADQGLDDRLLHLDALITGENDAVAMRAIRLKLDIAMRNVESAANLAGDLEIDAMLQAKQRELTEQLRAFNGDEPSSTNGADR